MRGSRFLAALTAAASFTIVASLTGAQEPTTAVGFVAAVGEGTVLVSNVPIGQPGGRMMMVQQEGAPPPAGAVAPVPSGEAKTGTAGEAKAGDAPPTFTVKKADEKADGKAAAAGKPGEAVGEGKVITLSREDAEKMKGMWVQADPNAKPATRTEGADEKVAFTEYQVTPDTERPADLAPGTKVKVTYTVEGEKRVATKIEVVNH